MRSLKRLLFQLFFTFSVVSLAACGGSSNGTPFTGGTNPGVDNTGDNNGDTGDTDDTGDTGDTGDNGNDDSNGDDDGNGDDAQPSGTFSLAITDAPIDHASHVYVAFSGVTLHPAEGDPVEFMFEENRTIDLLALQGTQSEHLLNEENVPPGDYESIHIHVNASHDGVLDSYVEMNDGTQLELGLEEENQLNITQAFTVVADEHTDFTVDLDLRRSLILPEGETDALLRPSLRLVHTQQAGSIACTVDDLLISTVCENPDVSLGAVYIYEGADVTPMDVRNEDTDPLTTALVVFEDDVYYYEAGFLPAGEYTVAYTCDAVNDDPEAADELDFYGVGNAEVTAGQETLFHFGSGSSLFNGDGEEGGEEETTGDETTEEA
ncbi:DUF4382 domain-containing protein [Marinimicrobium sp. ABcell2]|uniref:DUF4382 domain-containing protein n=1 Tax=Marinimicrobium sp. ABcell2 TaxID=3069751 RepID=UPI0027AEAC85|nr:DUF4382 domain-containing protein [Marinimicrobium sp. ABcell2]MDQ2075736.1 DUF4382 domain-containing protein [Marinimicrobium sp. ABcell2]